MSKKIILNAGKINIFGFYLKERFHPESRAQVKNVDETKSCFIEENKILVSENKKESKIKFECFFVVISLY